jgi:hypothetical protein
MLWLVFRVDKRCPVSRSTRSPLNQSLSLKRTGNKHYSGPIRAITKWQTGIAIDLQSTLASRSGNTGNHPPHSSGDIGPHRQSMTSDTSVKLGNEHFFEEILPTVTIETAASHDGTISEMGSDASHTSSGTEVGRSVGQEAVARTRSMGDEREICLGEGSDGPRIHVGMVGLGGRM